MRRPARVTPVRVERPAGGRAGGPGRYSRHDFPRHTSRSRRALVAALTALQGPSATDGHGAHPIAQRVAAALAPGHPSPDVG
ncbi:hypothetical protein ACIPPS_07450 [Streptomyces sp. NPDC090127]|uniref:hypothetical protein n=1 Tax=Streptomyces sp. NPDC090127 TaxID=3365953 RepID=UPI003821A2D1